MEICGLPTTTKKEQTMQCQQATPTSTRQSNSNLSIKGSSLLLTICMILWAFLFVILYKEARVLAPRLTGHGQLVENIHRPAGHLELRDRLLPQNGAEPWLDLGAEEKPNIEFIDKNKNIWVPKKTYYLLHFFTHVKGKMKTTVRWFCLLWSCPDPARHWIQLYNFRSEQPIRGQTGHAFRFIHTMLYYHLEKHNTEETRVFSMEIH